MSGGGDESQSTPDWRLGLSQVRIAGSILIQVRLELLREIARRHAPEEFPTLRAEPGIASTASPTAFVSKLIAEAHASSVHLDPAFRIILRPSPLLRPPLKPTSPHRARLATLTKTLTETLTGQFSALRRRPRRSLPHLERPPFVAVDTDHQAMLRRDQPCCRGDYAPAAAVCPLVG